MGRGGGVGKQRFGSAKGKLGDMVLKARSLAEVYASGRPIICCKECGERVWAPAGGVGQLRKFRSLRRDDE